MLHLRELLQDRSAGNVKKIWLNMYCPPSNFWVGTAMSLIILQKPDWQWNTGSNCCTAVQLLWLTARPACHHCNDRVICLNNACFRHGQVERQRVDRGVAFSWTYPRQ